MSASYVDEAYQQQPTFDRARVQLGARLSRDLASRLSWNLGADYARDDARVDGGDSSETTLASGLTWRAGRSIFVDLQFGPDPPRAVERRLVGALTSALKVTV